MSPEDHKFITDFAAFCRTKGDEEYDYSSTRNCACCQFLRECRGFSDPRVGGISGYRDASGGGFNNTPFPEGVSDVLVRRSGDSGGWTFSALADRLEALIEAVS